MDNEKHEMTRVYDLNFDLILLVTYPWMSYPRLFQVLSGNVIFLLELLFILSIILLQMLLILLLSYEPYFFKRVHFRQK